MKKPAQIALVGLSPHPCPPFRLKIAPVGFARGVQGVVGGRSWTALVNDRPEAGLPLVGLSNELGVVDGDGWALIPYGDHPNDRGLQRFGKAEAEQMVKYFKSGWNRIKRAFVGMPILRGHPDMATTVRAELKREKDQAKRAGLQSLINSIERRYPDKTVYGTITDIEAREDGLAIRPVLTEEGMALVNEEGLTCFSPHWLGLDAEPVNGQPVKRPVYLVSIGLTNRPNIPGTSLVNDQPEAADAVSPAMKKHILALLAALGRPLANEATDEQITAELEAAAPTAQALLARPEPTALANEQSRATQLEGQLSTLNTALANERTELAAVRKQRNELLVAEAIRGGRITEAQKPVWLGRLDRDFAAESVALANETGAVKTRGTTGDLGSRKPANSARDQFTALVNERQAKHPGETWDASWAAVKGTKEGAQLFKEMDAPTA